MSSSRSRTTIDSFFKKKTDAPKKEQKVVERNKSSKSSKDGNSKSPVTAAKTTSSSSSSSSSTPRSSLESSYKQLFNVDLPGVARLNKWPVHLNHCLLRITLDQFCGKCWYEHWDQKRGALKSMTDEELQSVVALAEKLKKDKGSENESLAAKWNVQSLDWRKKIGPRHARK
eukprot:TRINITY_DN45724_c0_g1_i1.p1 TRINITY_DN45724_c0_g1~~TRINITY_DN45724_c0_g1_i1.p1  ORF type:complete len:172 (-),score=18.42 TRINITY_DN45724_c0_g1_i1:129-644(-)